MPFMRQRRAKGQSFVELALILPVLLLLLAGLVEVGFFIFSYLTALDLTREAARFASIRDFRQLSPPDHVYAPETYCKDDLLNYYQDTACFFIDPDLNPWLTISPTQYADVTISVFTVDSSNTISNRWPDNGTGVWSLYNNNWQKDCDGNIVRTQPFFTNSDIQSMFLSNAPHAKGLVLVEVWYCYHQVLNLPLIAQIFPQTYRMHAYTIMPAPEAIPTPTPIAYP